MIWAGCVKAGPNRSENDLGDDAYFISNSQNAAGVADGVGSWRTKGIQSGTFTRSLMTNAKNLVESGFNCFDAVSIALNDWSGNYGSTTLMMAQQVDDKLYVTQLGDSQILVLRKGKIVYFSEPQEHMFNVPYQVGSQNDSLEDSERYSIDIQSGDTVIIGTDGLFNNIYPTHIADIVKQYPAETDAELLQDLANFLCDYAWNRSQDPNYWSPFVQRKYEAGLITRDESNSGGKPDDIAVVVGRIE